MTIDELKNKDKVTREDIANLFESIGKPGTKQKEKLEALKSLNIQNTQGHDISLLADSWSEF